MVCSSVPSSPLLPLARVGERIIPKYGSTTSYTRGENVSMRTPDKLEIGDLGYNDLHLSFLFKDKSVSPRQVNTNLCPRNFVRRYFIFWSFQFTSKIFQNLKIHTMVMMTDTEQRKQLSFRSFSCGSSDNDIPLDE
jgi:hypothetical protein